MEFEIEPTITKQFLLTKQSQETYLEYYLGIPVKKGLFRSPLRDDKSPTCSFYRNKAGDIIFKDFSGHFSGNFIAVVMFKYSCSYYKALQIIANDFGYIVNKNIVKNEKPITESKHVFNENTFANIRVQIQEFSSDEIEWWRSYGITKSILKKFRVYSCKVVFLNGVIFSFSGKRTHIYGYYRGKDSNKNELWRIYFPGRKKYKFLSNWKYTMIQGSKQLPESGDLLVVTKSLKDVMCLYNLGVTAIAPNSENIFLTESQYSKLLKRFKKIVLFYDNDLPGIRSMNKIRKQFNIQCLWIPRKFGAKDISDYYKKYGRESTIKLINDGKNKIGIE